MEMAKKPKMPKKPEIKSRDPNWRDMEAIRKSGAAGSHKDKKALDLAPDEEILSAKKKTNPKRKTKAKTEVFKVIKKRMNII